MATAVRALRLIDAGQLEELLEMLVVDDQVFEEKDAAAFLHVSVTTLRGLAVPRAQMTDADDGRRAPIRFLRSQLILYVLARTKPRLRIVREVPT